MKVASSPWARAAARANRVQRETGDGHLHLARGAADGGAERDPHQHAGRRNGRHLAAPCAVRQPRPERYDRLPGRLQMRQQAGDTVLQHGVLDLAQLARRHARRAPASQEAIEQSEGKPPIDRQQRHAGQRIQRYAGLRRGPGQPGAELVSGDLRYGMQVDIDLGAGVVGKGFGCQAGEGLMHCAHRGHLLA